jgi:hypothetical protein
MKQSTIIQMLWQQSNNIRIYIRFVDYKIGSLLSCPEINLFLNYNKWKNVSVAGMETETIKQR